MSALIVSHDLHIMMLEFAVNNLYVPRTSVFDSAILKKTTVMFRLLDEEWTILYPHRSDYQQYRGSNYEHEAFHGGKSVVFSLPEASLKNSMKDVDLQIHISKDISKYFEMHPSQNVGFVIVKLDKLFNGIINELKDRRELAPYLHFHEREPISRSMKGAFAVLNEDSEESGSQIDLYIRLSYFGKSITTEIITPGTMTKGFYAQEESNEMYPYQCRELKAEELRAGYWGSVTFIPPMKPQNLQCDCQEQRKHESPCQKTDMNQQKQLNEIKEGEENGKPSIDKRIAKDKNEIRKGKSKEKEGNEKETKKVRKKKGKERKETQNAMENKKEKKMDEKKEPGKEKKEREDESKTEKGKKVNKENIKSNEDKGELEKRDVEIQTKRVKKKKRDEETKAHKVERDEDIRKDNEQETRGKKKEKIEDEIKERIDANKIKMLRRRCAGPVTVGIPEKKIRNCVPFSPPCPCYACNLPVYHTSCTFLPTPYPQERTCGNNLELSCT